MKLYKLSIPARIFLVLSFLAYFIFILEIGFFARDGLPFEYKYLYLALAGINFLYFLVTLFTQNKLKFKRHFGIWNVILSLFSLLFGYFSLERGLGLTYLTGIIDKVLKINILHLSLSTIITLFLILILDLIYSNIDFEKDKETRIKEREERKSRRPKKNATIKLYKISKAGKVLLVLAFLAYFIFVLEIGFFARDGLPFEYKYLYLTLSGICFLYFLLTVFSQTKLKFKRHFGIWNLILSFLCLFVGYISLERGLSLAYLTSFIDKVFKLNILHLSTMASIILFIILILDLIYSNIDFDKTKNMVEEVLSPQDDESTQEESIEDDEESVEDEDLDEEETDEDEVLEEPIEEPHTPKHLSIVYRDKAKPGFELLFFDENNSYLSSEYVNLDQNQIENGLPLPTINLQELFEPYIDKKIKSASVLLDSSKVLKVTNAYPKMSHYKILKMYQKDMKENYQDIKEKHRTYIQEYKHNMGTIIYTYLIPNHIYNYALRLTRHLGLKLEKVDLYQKFLLSNLLTKYNENLIYLHESNDSISMVISYGGILTGSSTFPNTKDSINRNIFGIAMKHFYELEQTHISKFYTNSSSLDSEVLEKELIEMSLDFSLIKGIKK